MNGTTYDAPREGSTTPRLSEDQRHRVLANDRRRAACRVLEERTEPLSLDDLAGKVVARLDGHAEAGPERTRISLHHTHLPLLDQVGIVDYDVEAHDVTPRPAVLDAL